MMNSVKGILMVVLGLGVFPNEKLGVIQILL
ncbi:MAG: hypothetical protein H6Q67_1399 [Firmicutes bacterium]|nr:hypothetical protein [Bacillota bacterium]